MRIARHIGAGWPGAPARKPQSRRRDDLPQHAVQGLHIGPRQPEARPHVAQVALHHRALVGREEELRLLEHLFIVIAQLLDIEGACHLGAGKPRRDRRGRTFLP